MMRRPVTATLAVVIVALVVLRPVRADPPERTPVVIVDQPGAPVGLTELRAQVSLMPVGRTLTTVWLVRGVVTNVTTKRIVGVEMAWVLIGVHDETTGTVTNRYALALDPREHRLVIVGVITDLLYKPGVRVLGLVRRVQFADGSIWAPPPANMARSRAAPRARPSP